MIGGGRVVFLVLAAGGTAITGAARVGPNRLPNFAPGLVRLKNTLAGPGEGPPTLPGNGGNATSFYRTLQRDLIFIERITALVLRMTTRAAGWLQRWITRSVGYPPRVIVIEMSGIITADEDARSYTVSGRPELMTAGVEVRGQGDGIINLARIDRLVTKAFNAHGARAVCLLINSPGGSPAQSSLIYQRLRALRKQHKRVPLLAFVEDSACSGGYYIACAADEIVADPSSLVGSIGVISRGFGYVKAIKKQGVTRRVHSAGESKSGLDPYMPLHKRDLANQERLLGEIHSNFVEAVKEGRGDRLKPEAAARIHHATTRAGCGGWLGKPGKRTLRKLQDGGAGLFDGSVYTGEVGLEIGLVDGVGEMRAELEKRFGRFVQLERMEEERLDYSRLLRWLF